MEVFTKELIPDQVFEGSRVFQMDKMRPVMLEDGTAQGKMQKQG